MWQTLNSTFLGNTAPPPPLAPETISPGQLRVSQSDSPSPPLFPVGRGCHVWCALFMQGKIWLRIQLSASSVFCFFLFFFLFGNCVKLSVALTMSLSFRSNVNYIPPPQEVSFVFCFLFPSLDILFLSFRGTWAMRSPKHNANTESCFSWTCPRLSPSPRISNTPSRSCSEKLAFLRENTSPAGPKVPNCWILVWTL